MKAFLKSNAVMLNQDLTLRLAVREFHAPTDGQALVRIEWAGVCGSDLHVMATGDWVARWPATLGHEIVGTIESCPGGELAKGTLVVVDSRVSCGQCEGCAESPILCASLAWVGEAVPGGYQERAVFEVSSLYPCPEAIEPGIAVLAEPLAVAAYAVSRLTTPPASALVLGYGPIGALVHRALLTRWPAITVSVSEPQPARRELAEAYGAALIHSSSDRTWPLVIETAGFVGSLSWAIAHAARGGAILIVALGHGVEQLRSADMVEKSLTIIGSNGFDDQLPGAITQLAESPNLYRPLITEAVLLEEAAERLVELARQPAAGKLVIRP